jgi:hypothetical protein
VLRMLIVGWMIEEGEPLVLVVLEVVVVFV